MSFATLTLADEPASERLAEDLAPILRAGDCLLLSGDLGMGKTTIARALIRAFVGNLNIEVPSPTFTLMNQFDEGRVLISHFDLYRISDEDELEEIGFREALTEGITLIEWPERAAQAMPDTALTVRLQKEQQGRKAILSGNSAWRERIERTFEIRSFLDKNRCNEASRRFLQGDASSRSYEKIKCHDGRKAVLMDNPAQEEGPIIKDGKRYSELAHLAEDVRPFVAIGETLRERGFPAPEIYAQDLEAGLLLLEDFGHENIVVDQKPSVERYEVAIDVLAAMHEHDWPEMIDLPDGSKHFVPHFDETIFHIEISLLGDWYAPHVIGQSFSVQAQMDYDHIWQELFEIVSTGEKSLLLRDYHSPNLMWRDGEAGLNRIGLIDYQDALIGPSAYDVASLCQDARQDVSRSMEAHLKARYVAARRQESKSFDADTFERDYAIIAAERNTRLLGLWPRLKHRDGKPHYMNHMERTKDYLKRSLKHPVLKRLKLWYDSHVAL